MNYNMLDYYFSKQSFYIKKKIFYKINFNKAIKELDLHYKITKRLINKKKIKNDFGAALNLISPKYPEINKIIKIIYNIEEIYKYFKSKFIINSIAAVTLYPRNKNNYSRSSIWHRDVRYLNIGSKRTDMILCIIPLTNVTKENGATKLKHKLKNGTYKIFQPEANRSDIIFADARTLHKGGVNRTEEERIIITISLTPPHIKPVLDYSKFLKYYKKKNEYLKQMLGYNSRTPSNLKEFYQKSMKKRFFLKDQMKI